MSCYAGETKPITHSVSWVDYDYFHQDEVYCQLCRVVQQKADDINYTPTLSWYLIGTNTADGALADYDWEANPSSPLYAYYQLFLQMVVNLGIIINAEYVESCKRWHWYDKAGLLALRSALPSYAEKENWLEFVTKLRELLDAMVTQESDAWDEGTIHITCQWSDRTKTEDFDPWNTADIRYDLVDPYIWGDTPGRAYHRIEGHVGEDSAWQTSSTRTSEGPSNYLSVYNNWDPGTIGEAPLNCSILTEVFADGAYWHPWGGRNFSRRVLTTTADAIHGFYYGSFTGTVDVAEDLEATFGFTTGGGMAHSASPSSITVTIPAGTYNFVDGACTDDLGSDVVSLSGTPQALPAYGFVTRNGPCDYTKNDPQLEYASYTISPGTGVQVVTVCVDECGHLHPQV